MKHRARRGAALVAGSLVLLLSLALVSCGRTSPPEPVEAGAPAAPARGSTNGPSLPTLPPIQQRMPQQFDERGCVRAAGSQPSCASTAQQIDAASGQPAPDGTRQLAGFTGKYWSTDAPTGSVVVLESSITTGSAADGGWSAAGLVRNQQADPVGGVTVTAELIGRDGWVIEAVRGDASVHSLRPGEPAPFSLASTKTKATDVASVKWAAEVSTTATAIGGRDLELQTFWVRAPTDPRRIDNDQHHDPATGPRPLVIAGAVTNRGTTVVANPHVTVAWLDASGRVLVVRDVPTTVGAGPVSALPASGAADFLASVDPAAANAIPAESMATPMLWGGP